MSEINPVDALNQLRERLKNADVVTAESVLGLGASGIRGATTNRFNEYGEISPADQAEEEAASNARTE